MSAHIRVVELFCGLGGAALGLYAAADALGIEVKVVDAIDVWPIAVKVYNANHRHPIARVADVKQLTRADLPPHDLVIGGPPCQPFSVAGRRSGHSDPRNCLPDFLRLAAVNEPGCPAWLMENVRSRLINAPWSEKLCAANYGDVTSRKRWFYSNYLLHVVPTPGPRRIRDIRDHDEDERILRKRGFWTGDEMAAVAEDDAVLATLSTSIFHGTKNNGCGRPTTRSKIRCKAVHHGHYDDALGASGAGKGHPNMLAIATRTGGVLQQWDDGDVLPSNLSNTHHDISERLKIGLRGNSASAFEDGEVLGSLLANAFHANEQAKLVGCRNPSLLEMARAHSIPDSFDWSGATKTQRGQLIANSWPAGMAEAVFRALLPQLQARRYSGLSARKSA